MSDASAESEPLARSQLQVSDFISVEQRLETLGCTFPAGIAVLPRNFEDASDRAALQMPSEASTVRTLLRNEGLPVGTILPSGEKAKYISLNSFGWIGPTLFVSAGLMSTDPSAFQIALGVLTNYISDLLKGTTKSKTVKLDVVVERKGDRLCKRVSYEGPIEGLATLVEAVNRVADES
jgi:hypothetical protein